MPNDKETDGCAAVDSTTQRMWRSTLTPCDRYRESTNDLCRSWSLGPSCRPHGKKDVGHDNFNSPPYMMHQKSGTSRCAHLCSLGTTYVSHVLNNHMQHPNICCFAGGEIIDHLSAMKPMQSSRKHTWPLHVATLRVRKPRVFSAKF